MKYCKACGKDVGFDRRSNHCSYTCARTINGYKDEPEPSWYIDNGYFKCKVMFKAKEIPIKKHRWLVEKRLGRPLLNSEHIHHADGNTLNNSDENLIITTLPEHTSITNQEKIYKSKTGFRGVHKGIRGGYKAKVTFKGHQMHLGSFKTPEEASHVYEAARKRLFGHAD